MKKIISTIFFAIILAIITFTNDSLAATEIYSEEEIQLMNETNELLNSTKVTQEELEKQGWQLVNTDETQTYSIPGTSKIVNSFYESSSNPGLYLVQAWWEYNTTWDTGSSNANDLLALAILKNGQPIDKPATNGGISVFDSSGNKLPYGWVSSYNQSGAVYHMNDYEGTGIGDSGSIWFYISKPSSTSGTFYVNSIWEHNWASKSITLNNLSLKYPLAIEASWSSTGLSKWTVTDQDEIKW